MQRPPGGGPCARPPKQPGGYKRHGKGLGEGFKDRTYPPFGVISLR
jgi:hypothetical protein